MLCRTKTIDLMAVESDSWWMKLLPKNPNTTNNANLSTQSMVLDFKILFKNIFLRETNLTMIDMMIMLCNHL